MTPRQRKLLVSMLAHGATSDARPFFLYRNDLRDGFALHKEGFLQPAFDFTSLEVLPFATLTEPGIELAEQATAKRRKSKRG